MVSYEQTESAGQAGGARKIDFLSPLLTFVAGQSGFRLGFLLTPET
jgi:hypothetical protein